MRVLTVYIPDQPPENYDGKDWTWHWEPEEIYGEITKWETLQYNVSLKKMSTLIIKRKDGSLTLKIDGNFTTMEQTIKEDEDEKTKEEDEKTINTSKEENGI